MPTLNWIGKDKVVNHHHEVPFCVLKHEKRFDAPQAHCSIHTQTYPKMVKICIFKVGSSIILSAKRN